jgi:hypothetical protein
MDYGVIKWAQTRVEVSICISIEECSTESGLYGIKGKPVAEASDGRGVLGGVQGGSGSRLSILALPIPSLQRGEKRQQTKNRDDALP